MKPNIMPVFYFIFIAILFTCSNRDDFYTVEIVDGVRTVHNIKPMWGDEGRMSLELVRKIGGLDVVDENLQFYRPNRMAFDSKGNMYVLDWGNYRIQKIDPQGNFLLSIGKRGEGPGEFSSPGAFQIDIYDKLYVGDNSTNRIDVFNTDGTFLGSINLWEKRIAQDFRTMPNGDFLVNSFRSLLARSGGFNNGENNDISLLQIYDERGKILHEFGEMRNYEDVDNLSAFHSFYLSVDEQNFSYLAYLYQNKIEKYSQEGKLLFSTDRILNFEESTRFEMFERDKLSGSNRRRKVNAISKGLEVDEKGRIFVVTHLRQLTENELRSGDRVPGKDELEDQVTLEVYSNDGILLTRIPLSFGTSRNLAAVYNNKLYFVDSTYEMAVYEYKIIEK